MKKNEENELVLRACRLLGRDWSPDKVRSESMTPDGSLRRFCRLLHESGRRVVAIAPPPGDEAGLREARSGWRIGCHLFACGAPVVEQFCFDDQSGLLVCEDLGDTRLHDLIVLQGGITEEVEALYHLVVEHLALMQVRARENFNPAWCWDSHCYDRSVMLERESGYFLQALCKDLLGLSVAKQEINKEFSLLADRAARAEGSFFLHRDFQSRNIMVRHDRVCFIDFQAGRLGPVAYDLASLLIDPYAALAASLQDKLLAHYADVLHGIINYDQQQLKDEYRVLAVQRNLQILGAFAFLYNRRHKAFFRQYIEPALLSLQVLLKRLDPGECRYLRALASDCLDALHTLPN